MAQRQSTRRGNAATQFEPIEQRRAQDYVAEQLRRQIALRLVPPGEPLPPERELASMFGVGRATVQRAIRMLVAEGRLESRRGRTGGNFVLDADTEPGLPDVLAEVRQDPGLIEEALVYRLEIEPIGAALAAVEASGRELRGIADAAARVVATEDDPIFDKHDVEFHLTLVAAAHNRLLAEGVEQARMLLSAAILALPESQMWKERSVREHAGIVDALQRRDPKLAKARMRRHLTHTDQGVRAILAALS